MCGHTGRGLLGLRGPDRVVGVDAWSLLDRGWTEGRRTFLSNKSVFDAVSDPRESVRKAISRALPTPPSTSPLDPMPMESSSLSEPSSESQKLSVWGASVSVSSKASRCTLGSGSMARGVRLRAVEA